jgi:hypothetical protein
MATVDHHYIPQCYLKRWANPADAQLQTFQHQPRGLHARKSSTKGTGYVPHLYTAKLNPDVGDQLETDLLQRIDNDAARLLDRFTSGGRLEFDPDEQSAWTLFLLSLMHRSPGRIDHFDKTVAEAFPSFADGVPPEVEAEYAVHRRPGDPNSIGEFFRTASPKDVELGRTILLRQLFTSERLGTALNSMKRGVIRFSDKAKHELLTSDKPLIITNGLERPDVVVLLALSPRHLFVAAHDTKYLEPYGDTANADRVIKFNNVHVCEQAERYVYSTGTAQRSFITKYFPEPAAVG